jgi:hypothetical protein
LADAERKIALKMAFDDLKYRYVGELMRLQHEGVPVPVVHRGGWLSRLWRRPLQPPPALADALHELAVRRRLDEMNFRYLEAVVRGCHIGELPPEEVQWAVDHGLVAGLGPQDDPDEDDEDDGQ